MSTRQLYYFLGTFAQVFTLSAFQPYCHPLISQVIVLDEPTSAMDPKAEYEVFQKFRQLIKDQAAILISHRLSTVKMADRIYVMDKGSITESGTHQELMQLGGTYAYLFETQAKNYR